MDRFVNLPTPPENMTEEEHHKWVQFVGHKLLVGDDDGPLSEKQFRTALALPEDWQPPQFGE